MQVSKKLKAILIIIFFTVVIILPVCVALVREYGYDSKTKGENQNMHNAK